MYVCDDGGTLTQISSALSRERTDGRMFIYTRNKNMREENVSLNAA
jgi:hypothetical protein